MKVSLDKALSKAVKAHIGGRLQEAADIYESILYVQPNNPAVNHNMGILCIGLGRIENASRYFRLALDVDSSILRFWIGYIDTLARLDKLIEAKESVEYIRGRGAKPELIKQLGKWIKDSELGIENIQSEELETGLLQENSSVVYFNRGNSHHNNRQFDPAIDCYEKALMINPNFTDAYVNKGITFREKGELGSAILNYKKALNINPKLHYAYLNMGAAELNDRNIQGAINCFKEALAIKSNYTEAFWNLYGTARSIGEAQKWIERCLIADKNHVEAKLTNAALDFYIGKKDRFNDLIHSPLKDHALMRSFSWVFSLPKLPSLCFNRWDFFDKMIGISIRSRPYYEFGVWRGASFRYLMEFFTKGYGFDTFEGLPEKWHLEELGKYSAYGEAPEVQNGEFIAGKFEETLPVFFSEARPKASIVNFDADLYSSTICALDSCKSIIDEDTIMIFDEFIVNESWEDDEFRAWNEFCLKNNYSYEVLAVSFFTKQVAVRLI